MKNKNGIKKAIRFLMLCFFFVSVGLGAYAQKTVSGKVVDNEDLALPGVSVIVKGTTIGTVTGNDGTFSITNVNPDATLVFSFVGMTPQEIAVGTKTEFNVSMVSESIGLDEVVAIGYGTQKKANLTGSVGMATAERLENRPIVSTGQGMQGVIPNLNITFQNGDPASSANFNVRGFESINGGNPLILVDGVPMDLERLNPNDIASVTVLKDAAAGAVYGARAAFGVILVETKKGKSGKIRVTLSTEQSMSKPIYLIDPVEDPYLFVTEWNKANVRTSGNPSYDDNYVQGTKKYSENPVPENEWGVYNGELRYYGFNDYQNKLITDFAPQQKYDMNISGSTEKSNYYVSFGYLNKDGYLKNEEKNESYERYNVMMKADFKINDWLTLEEKIVFNSQVSDKPHFYNWDVNINTSARKKPIEPLIFPDLPYYLAEGDRDKYAQYIGMGFGAVNFMPYLEQGGRETFTTNDTWLTQGVNITPLKGLRIRGDFSYRTYWRERQDVAAKINVIRTQDLKQSNMIDNGLSGDDFIQNEINRSEYYAFNTYAEYTVDQIENHYIKAMVGFNQEWGANRTVMATARQLVTPLITDLNATTGAQQTSGGKNHLSLRGVFFRLNYSFKDRYLLEVNGRYDGTSRFPTDSRFGFFPSFSAAWRLSNEGFMASTRGWLDNLKIRASYGELGNQQLNSFYPYIASMGIGQSSYIMSGANRTPYVSPAGLVSNDLTWETVVTKNLGIDVTVLNQRLDASFDIYTRDTKNMLTRVTYPELLGTQAPQANAADLRTSGWELSVTWHDVIGQDWQYGINVALADNQSEVTKYDNPTGSLSEYYEGQKMGEIWGYVTEGIFQTDAEVAAHANQAQLGANWKAGDIAYKDLGGGPNGEPDGKITPGKNTLSDPGDQQIIGYSHPRYSYGINPDVSYKNWSLDIFFQGLFRDYLPTNGNWMAFYPYNAGHMEYYYITESWTPENPNAYFAAATMGTNTKKNIQPQSRYVQNGAYIRLKNLTLNYNLPHEWMNKIGLSDAQIYFAGMNLWEATKMHKPIDPEAEFNNNTGQIRDDLTQEYYFQRTFSLGIKVTF